MDDAELTVEQLRHEQDLDHRTISQLQASLRDARLIGMAIGITMERQQQTPEDAFQTLALASQAQKRHVSDVAREMVGDIESGDVLS